MIKIIDYLTEETIESEYKRYDNFLTPEQFKEIVSADPTAKNGFTGHYTKWLVKQFRNLSDNSKNRFSEDSYKYHKSLELFDQLKKKNKLPPNNRDINRMNFGSLNSLIEPFSEKDITDYSASKKEYDEIIHTKGNDGFDWYVYRPNTEEASCYLGQGTKWCTAARSKNNRFNQYAEEGNLYIVVRGDDLKTTFKWQFQSETDQFMDYRDEEDFLSIKFFPKEIQDFVLNFDWSYSTKKSFRDVISSGDVYAESLDRFENLSQLKYYFRKVNKYIDANIKNIVPTVFDVESSGLIDFYPEIFESLSEQKPNDLYSNLMRVFNDHGYDLDNAEYSEYRKLLDDGRGIILFITKEIDTAITDSMDRGFFKIINELFDVNQYNEINIPFRNIDEYNRFKKDVLSLDLDYLYWYDKILSITNRSLDDLFDVSAAVDFLVKDEDLIIEIDEYLES